MKEEVLIRRVFEAIVEHAAEAGEEFVMDTWREAIGRGVRYTVEVDEDSFWDYM